MKPIKPYISALLLFSLISCAHEGDYQRHQIATIDEASGIDFCDDSNTLIVANDEGSFYEITPQGEILSRHKLGDFDLEGVVCEKETLTFAIEEGALLEVHRHSQQTKHLPLKGETAKITKRSGIEGITKIGEVYYLAIQSKNKADAKILITQKNNQYTKVIHELPSNIIDTSGLVYHNHQLYILSDTQDRLYIYNLETNQTLQEIKLPPFDQEGIAFDAQGNLYLTDDNGAVLRYHPSEFNLTTEKATQSSPPPLPK